MKVGEGVDQLAVHLPPSIRVEIGKCSIEIGSALFKIHDVEDRSEDSLVLAKSERFGHREGEFPVCEDVAARSIALPFFPEMSEGQVARVAGAVDEVLRGERGARAGARTRPCGGRRNSR